MIRLWNWIKRLFGKKAPEPVIFQPVDTGEVIGAPGFYLGKIVGARPGEIEMIKRAVGIVEAVVRSAEFYEECINANFTNTRGLSNLEIYQLFTSRPITINVSMFTGSFMQNHVYKTVGYDSASDEFVHVNRYFVDEPVMLASLMLHEVAHSLAFSHASAREKTSIPYSMNGILERIAGNLGLAWS